MNSKKPGLGWEPCGTRTGAPTGAPHSYVANAVFTPRFATVANTEHVAPGVRQCSLPSDDVRHCRASTSRSAPPCFQIIVALLINQGIAVAIPAALSSALLIGAFHLRLKLEPSHHPGGSRHVAWVAQVVGDGQLVPFVPRSKRSEEISPVHRFRL